MAVAVRTGDEEMIDYLLDRGLALMDTDEAVHITRYEYGEVDDEEQEDDEGEDYVPEDEEEDGEEVEVEVEIDEEVDEEADEELWLGVNGNVAP
jgi:hypothetical protein